MPSAWSPPVELWEELEKKIHVPLGSAVSRLILIHTYYSYGGRLNDMKAE